MDETRHIHCDAKLFRVVSGFMPKQDVRYFLNGVFVEPHDKEGVYIVATDGHRMGVAHDPCGKANGPWICEVPAELRRALKKKEAQRVLFEGDQCVVLGEQDGLPEKVCPSSISPAIRAKPVDGKYPEWQDAVPRPNGKVMANNQVVTLNSTYLAALKDVGQLGQFSGVAFTQYELGACVFRFDEIKNFFGIVMHMRSTLEKVTVPTWCSKPKTKKKRPAKTSA